MSRSPLTNEPPLLEPERAIRLSEDATAFFHAPRDGYHELDRLAATTAMDAAHLALETAIDTGDPRVLAAALELATESVRWPDEYLEHVLAQAARVILPATTSIENRTRECARSRSAFVRAATATGLGARALRSLRGEGDEVDAEAAAIVAALAKDPDPRVRGAARDALGGAAPPAWLALFPRDPLASLPAAEAARLRGPLDRAAEALEEGVTKDAKPLADAIAELPDALAAPLLESWIRTPFVTLAESLEPLFDRWLAIDVDGARLAEWLRSGDFEHVHPDTGARLGAALSRRSSEQASAVVLRVAALMPELPRRPYAAMLAEALVKRAWPDDADPTPLLELLLGAPLAEAADRPNEEAKPFWMVVDLALGSLARFPLLADAVVAAFVAGCPGRWARVADSLSRRLVELAHPRLRAHAETLLREGEGAELTWALRHLSAGGHDPLVDPPIASFLSNAARDPRLRAAMLGSEALREPAQKALRKQFAAGELPPDEAITYACSIGAGALRKAEWAVVRRAREQLEEPSERAWALELLPAYAEWTQEDHAFADALVEEHGADDEVALSIALSLQPVGGPSRPEIAPLLERLLGRASELAGAVVRRALQRSRGETVR